jgi:hypothetical protein
MSAIQFITYGGMASISCDLLESDQEAANDIIKSFGEKVRKYALALQVPASVVKVQQCTLLFVAKDIASFHFVFVDAPGGTSVTYKNLSTEGRLDLQSIVHEVRIHLGEVAWAFSCPLNVAIEKLDGYIQQIVEEYVKTVLQAQEKPNKNISSEALSMPEIASGLEKFREDYPLGSKTAFIMMQFGESNPHQLIANCIKQTLGKHNITALRADDKEYMDDLFPNIKTYMHACDFGVAVYERITADEFNPNVSLEVGYMLGMGKKVLHLKDKSLKLLQTDLTGKLYKPFDTNDIQSTMPQQIEKWLKDKGLTK